MVVLIHQVLGDSLMLPAGALPKSQTGKTVETLNT